jgi:hypothetical protein
MAVFGISTDVLSHKDLLSRYESGHIERNAR